MRLLIAGHGETDPGAVGSGRKEADVARDLVSMVREFTRDADVYPVTKNFYRQLKAGTMKLYEDYDRIVEVHFNAFNGKAEGSEVLMHSKVDSVSLTGCAEGFLKDMQALGFVNRGIKRRGDLQNMNYFYNKGIPYVLIETCFIDNKSDMQRYDDNKERVARAIAEGFFKYKEPEKLYRVQVGAFANKANAELLRGKLRNAGYDAFIV